MSWEFLFHQLNCLCLVEESLSVNLGCGMFYIGNFYVISVRFFCDTNASVEEGIAVPSAATQVKIRVVSVFD